MCVHVTRIAKDDHVGFWRQICMVPHQRLTAEESHAGLWQWNHHTFIRGSLPRMARPGWNLTPYLHRIPIRNSLQKRATQELILTPELHYALIKNLLSAKEGLDASELHA